MQLRKKIKWTLIGILSVSFLLFLTLIVHIAVMVYHKAPLPFEHVQMARADFQAPLSATQLKKIKERLEQQKGIQSTFFNTKDRNVVYTFDNRENTAGQIYHLAIQDPAYHSSPYTVTQADLASGCPVIDNHSFYGKLTAAVSKIIN